MRHEQLLRIIHLIRVMGVMSSLQGWMRFIGIVSPPPFSLHCEIRPPLLLFVRRWPVTRNATRSKANDEVI